MFDRHSADCRRRPGDRSQCQNLRDLRRSRATVFWKLSSAIERRLCDGAADAQEDAAIWQRMVSSLLRTAPGLTDPWNGLEVPPLGCCSLMGQGGALRCR